MKRSRNLPEIHASGVEMLSRKKIVAHLTILRSCPTLSHPTRGAIRTRMNAPSCTPLLQYSYCVPLYLTNLVLRISSRGLLRVSNNMVGMLSQDTVRLPTRAIQAVLRRKMLTTLFSAVVCAFPLQAPPLIVTNNFALVPF
jgi:hypothetical protein